MKRTALVMLAGVMAAGQLALAAETKQAAKGPVAADQPIEISSDKLDVFQPEHKAIFTGNVIAKQGTTTMRAEKMVVFYHQDDAKNPPPGSAATAAPKPAKANDGAAGQGIYRIESSGKVVFVTPTETAQGDTAIYNVDDETIDLIGQSVTLIRDKNVLKGTKLNYNMATGRSVLTSGAGGVASSSGGKGNRVHGLFVPQQKDDGNTKKDATSTPKTGQ